jgi:hypothetical protein
MNMKRILVLTCIIFLTACWNDTEDGKMVSPSKCDHIEWSENTQCIYDQMQLTEAWWNAKYWK